MINLFIKDFKKLNMDFIGLYLTTFISSLLVLITSHYKNSVDVLTAIYVISMGVSTICMIVCLILPFFKYYINNIRDFSKSIKDDLFDAKVISTVMTILLSLIVVVVAFVNTYSSNTIFKFINDLFNDYHLAKNFSSFIIELFVKMNFIYISSLVGIVISSKNDEEKALRSVIFSILIMVLFHYIIKYLVIVIAFERKFILMILLYICSFFVIYLFGKYEFNKIK